MNRWIIFFTIVLALLVRLYKLGVIPNGFFFDEATIAYQSYSLLMTGHDTWGSTWPLFSFKDYGEYILPLGIYGQIPFVLLGGLTVFASRLPHALLGTLLVLLTYFVAKPLFGKKVALMSALMLTVSPLALGWSRFVFEGNFGAVFFFLGLILFIHGLKKPRLLILSMVFFGLSMLSYHVFLVLTPIFVMVLGILHYKILSFKKSDCIIPCLIIGFFILWGIGSVFSGAGRQRFKQASTLLSADKIDVLNHQRSYCELTLGKICRLVYNRPNLAVLSYIDNYLEHFSVNFLAVDGSFLRRNILPRSGILQEAEVLGFFVCLIFLLRLPGSSRYILLAGLFIYPLANSFTGVGEISRVGFAAPFLSMTGAIGLVRISSFRKFSIPIFLLILLSTVFFLVNYFTVFPVTNAYYTGFGYDQVYSWIRANQQKYSEIYITREYSGTVPYISGMFFLPVNPRDFLNRDKIERRQDVLSYYVIDRINNLKFFGKIEKLDIGERDFLIVTPEEVKSRNIQPLFIIRDPTGRILLEGISGKDYVNSQV